jgi:hypothetical protein
VLHKLGVRLRTFAPSRAFRWGGALLLFGLLQRLVLLLFYQPISYADTNAYMRMAVPLSKLTLKGYDGTRVPGYPALLAVAGLNEQTAWILQLVLGLIISMLLFWIVFRTTDSPALAVLVGGLYDLIPGQFLFESNLLSETLTTFFVVLCFTSFVAFGCVKSSPKQYFATLILGITACLPGMVRPYFFPVTLFFLPLIWFVGEGNWRKRLLRIAIYSIPPLIIQGGWLLWIRDTYHMTSPTVMSGYSLVQHTGEYFEFLPDDVAEIRDTYIQFRDAQIAERGVQTNAIWEAIPAMSEASGLGFYDLSRELHRLSIDLIRAHPGRYLANVVEGWINFWKAPVYWDAEALQSSLLLPIVKVLIWVGRGFSVLVNLVFLLLSLIAILSKRLRQRIGFDLFSGTAAGFIIMISIVQTLVDHGDNPRFLVPLQMLVFYVVIRSFWMGFRNRKVMEAT